MLQPGLNDEEQLGQMDAQAKYSTTDSSYPQVPHKTAFSWNRSFGQTFCLPHPMASWHSKHGKYSWQQKNLMAIRSIGE
ncbi:hypothetical protein BBH88_05695 [Planococcus antarcticus DSM 14505]|uniref:Uncharacterized protein n=1 Tax=Planococcus antarcticus DSM 14505 TaxID=1185653 RepID=A0ABM6D2U5_9BACL|nr:hypothetical protein BBH88_05695 [Planococcus antarcticus DSM 14505]